MRRRGAPPGVDHPRARFDALDLREIHKLERQGWSQREIAGFFADVQGRKLCHSTIGKIVRGESYGSQGRE